MSFAADPARDYRVAIRACKDSYSADTCGSWHALAAPKAKSPLTPVGTGNLPVYNQTPGSGSTVCEISTVDACAGGFLTADHMPGYKLNTVRVWLAPASGQPSHLQARLYTGGSTGGPGSVQALLTRITPYHSGWQEFACPASANCALDAGTNYRIVLAVNPDATNVPGDTNTYKWGTTDSTDEYRWPTSGDAIVWGISDSGWGLDEEVDNQWQSFASVPLMEVSAYRNAATQTPLPAVANAALSSGDYTTDPPGVTLTWDAATLDDSTLLDGYQAVKCGARNCRGTDDPLVNVAVPVSTSPGAAMTCSDGTTCWFRVRTLLNTDHAQASEHTDGPWSTALSFTPDPPVLATPANLRAGVWTDDAQMRWAHVEWDYPAESERPLVANHRVEYCPTQSSTNCDTVDSNSGDRHVNVMQADTLTWYYRVRALPSGSAEPSGWSGWLEFTMPRPPPPDEDPPQHP